MQDLNLNVNEIIEGMASEIASLIKQVYIKNAEIKALKLHIAMSEEVAVERPEVTE